MDHRILIVDDNPTNLKLAASLLEYEGFAVDRAADAAEALEALARARPAMILMDLDLPGMDGLTLTRRLKADPATADIVIVALTASAMKGDEQQAYQAGCDGYIPKPFDTRQFAAQIRALLK